MIEGATVVTANDRLARRLHEQVAARWIAQGKTVWETPKALTLGALLDAQHEALCASGDPSAVRVLAGSEAEALWERVIETAAPRALRGEPLLQVRALAKLADDARGLVLRHRLPFGTAPTPSRTKSGELGLDAREFALWHEVYCKRLLELHATDGAALPDLIAAAWTAGVIAPPPRVVFEGFDETTPQLRALIAAMEAGGSAVTPPDVRIETPESLADALAKPAPHARRVVLRDARDEIERAAAWAAAKLKADPNARLGLVVLDLEAHRETVIDALDAMFDPAGRVLALDGDEDRLPAYNLSLGKPLSDWPLASDAFRLLRLLNPEVEWQDASAVLRSPFFQLGATLEQRMAIELWMRGHLPERFALDALLAAAAGKIGVGVGFVFGDFGGSRIPENKSDTDPDFLEQRPGPREQRLPSEWVGTVSQALRAAGWPGHWDGGRPLDRAERQTLDKWDDALRAACRLDATLGALSWPRFVARLAAICQELDFQPRAGSAGSDAPVQVLGLLEGAVLDFDALWVMGLDDERWPPAARPNPLLPIRMQVEAITPGSSAAERLVHAQRLTARLLAAAPEVVVSSPAHEGEAEHRPSPMIAMLEPIDLAADPTALPGFVPVERHWSLDQATERFTDAPVPLASGETARGGTSLIQHQSQCPFRAFAQHRLGAKRLEQPKDASDAALRGQIIHDVLHRVWGELGDHATLLATPDARLHEIVRHHCATAVEHAAREAPAQWPLRLRVLEQQRLQVRVLEWLALERERAPFTVVERERAHALELGGITLHGRIDRVDDVGGRPVYIDYKTGRVDWRKWLGARPQDPQLPIYATSHAAATDSAEPAGLLFAQVRVGEHGFTGVSAEDGLAPGVERWPPEGSRSEAVRGAAFDAPDWPALLGYWRTHLTTLAGEFTAGVATVTPERHACDHCHLQTLCRIDELGGPVEDEADAD